MKILREKGVTLANLLGKEKLDLLLAAGSRRAYSDGQMIQERGDTWPGFSIVNTGNIVAGNMGEDGSFLATALLRPGECYGEFAAFLGLPRSHSLWAQGPSEITHIQHGPFMRLFDNDPAISRAVLKLSLLRSYEMLDFLDAQRRLSLPARIARLLLTEVGADSGKTVVKCRQEDLAFMLGVSRVAIGKALKQLAARQLISLGYGQIDLRNVAGLKAWVTREDKFLSIPEVAPITLANTQGR